MFRFQLFYRNPNVLRQLQNLPLKRENIRNQFIRTIVNESKENHHEINTNSKTDVTDLRQLVNEQVNVFIANINQNNTK